MERLDGAPIQHMYQNESLKEGVYYVAVATVSSVALLALYHNDVCDTSHRGFDLISNCHNSLQLSLFSNIALPTIIFRASYKALRSFKFIS